MNPKGPDQICSAMVSIENEPGRVRPALPLRTKLRAHARSLAVIPEYAPISIPKVAKKCPQPPPPPLPHFLKFQNMGYRKKTCFYCIFVFTFSYSYVFPYCWALSNAFNVNFPGIRLLSSQPSGTNNFYGYKFIGMHLKKTVDKEFQLNRYVTDKLFTVIALF